MQDLWQVYANTGYSPIDEEHRLLSGLLCQLLASTSKDDVAGARAVMTDLVAAVESHFAHEDRLMLETRYPEHFRHRSAHQLFVVEAAKHARDLAEFGLTPEFQKWALGHVAEWFHFHIVSNDVALGRFLNAHKKSGASEAKQRPAG